MAVSVTPFTPTGLDRGEDRSRNPRQPQLVPANDDEIVAADTDATEQVDLDDIIPPMIPPLPQTR